MEIKPNNIYLGDSYEMIKDIPDKSVDLIYTDIPYLIENHGYGKSPLAKRLSNRDDELKGQRKKLQKKVDELKKQMDLAKNKDEYERAHCRHANAQNRLNLLTTQDITKGIDYKILDEFVRVMKYIYGVAKNKYMIC